MPRRDRTGPQGMGPRTGWGRGLCGLGLGWGVGRGRGLGRFFGRPWTKTNQTQSLRDYQQALKEELEDVSKKTGQKTIRRPPTSCHCKVARGGGHPPKILS